MPDSLGFSGSGARLSSQSLALPNLLYGSRLKGTEPQPPKFSGDTRLGRSRKEGVLVESYFP